MQRLRAIIATSLVIALVFPASALAAISSRIFDVTFVDSSKGFMAGVWYDSSGNPKGFVSSTANGGATWKASPAFPRTMMGVDALNATNAWGIGYFENLGWKSTNAGTSWMTSGGMLSPLAGGTNPLDVAHLSPSTVVVAGQQLSDPVNGDLATIWRTSDGGANWWRIHEVGRYPASSDGSVPQAFALYNAVDGAPGGTVAYAAGFENKPDDIAVFKQALLARTIDGGATWSNVALPAGTPLLVDVAAVDNNVGWAVGVTGTLARAIRTTDSGSSWMLSGANPPVPYAEGIAATSASHAIVVGSSGWVARTMDGGATWKTWRASIPNRVTIQSVAILDSTRAIAVGDDQLIVQLTLNADGSMTGVERRAVQGAILDTTAPVITVTGIADGASYKASVTPVVTAADDTDISPSVTAKLNGVNFASGTTISAENSYSLVVTAKDASGNTSSKTISFKIDKTAPTISVSGVSDGGTYGSTVTPMFSALDGGVSVAATAKLDGANFTSGTAVTAPGAHTLVVTATDAAGNTAERTINFTIVAGAPVIAISGVVDGASYQTSVKPGFSVTSPPGVTPQATLNGSPFVSGTTVDVQGEYTLVVTAQNSSGTSVETVVFRIDNQPPVITVEGIVADGSYNTAVAPTYTATDNFGVTSLTAELTRQGYGKTSYSSGTEIKDEGSYTLVVTAKDAAGFTATTTLTFTIDNQPPSVTIEKVIDGESYPAAVAPTFSATGGDVTSAKLNGNNFVSGELVTAQGTHTLVVTAADAAGNTATKTVTFSVDTTNPVVSFLNMSPNGSYTAITPNIAATDNIGVTSLSATLNGSPFVIGSTISVARSTAYTLSVTAKDAAGRTTTQSISFWIDTTPPSISVYNVANGGRYSSAVKPKFTGVDNRGVPTVSATLNGKSFVSETEVKAPGAYTLVINAVDAAGNKASRTVAFTITSTTSVSLSAPSTSKYRSARLAGRLYDSNGKTVGNKRIELQYSYDKRTWKTFATTYTNQKDSKGWKYVYTAKPSRKTYYRARFAGDSSYYADYSAIDATLPKVYVTRPSFGRTTLAYGKAYKATGYLKPRHKAYSYPVKIAAYRYENGKYRWKKSYAAKAYNYSSYTKYVRSIKLPSKGKWRLRVVHAADSLNAKTYSSYRYVTVK